MFRTPVDTECSTTLTTPWNANANNLDKFLVSLFDAPQDCGMTDFPASVDGLYPPYSAEHASEYPLKGGDFSSFGDYSLFGLMTAENHSFWPSPVLSASEPWSVSETFPVESVNPLMISTVATPTHSSDLDSPMTASSSPDQTLQTVTSKKSSVAKKYRKRKSQMTQEQLVGVIVDKRKRNTESARRARDRRLNNLKELETALADSQARCIDLEKRVAELEAERALMKI
jgi:hypothetical protein